MRRKGINIFLLSVLFYAVLLLITSCGHEHLYGDWIVKRHSTCSEKGIRVRACECGEKETDYIDYLSHTAGEWSIVKEASCASDGSKLLKCVICESIISTETIPAKEHSEGTWSIVVNPDCDNPGKKALLCLDCDGTIKEEIIPAKGHNEGNWDVIVNPDCDNPGKRALLCLDCNKVIKEETISAKGHTKGEWKIVNFASRTKEGLKELKCSVCLNTMQSKSLEATGIVFSLAEEKINKGLYLDAIDILNEYIVNISSNPEISEKIIECGDMYIDQQISESEKTFVYPDKDYEKAIKVIRTALQHYSDNEKLLSKLKYYESFEPVYLSDVKPYNSSYYFDRVDNVKDIFDNSHEHCIRITKNFQNAEGIYNLDRKYNVLKFTVFGLGDGNVGRIKIYADGNCIYSNTNIDPNTRPFDVTLDITGVLDLKFEMIQYYNSYLGECFGLAEVIVQKTKK